MLSKVRKEFAAALGLQFNICSQRTLLAFENVHREQFLPDGPWVFTNYLGQSWRTEDSDPRRVYSQVLVAIDVLRGLNNGDPGPWATWIDSLGIDEGDNVLHIGSGLGYYSAILADIVGASGLVEAWEIDPILFSKGKRNLESIENVDLNLGDGVNCFHAANYDVIVISAASSLIPIELTNALALDGRLFIPLAPSYEENGFGVGYAFKIMRLDRERFTAQCLSTASFYPLIGCRQTESSGVLFGAFASGLSPFGVQSFQRKDHAPGNSCWAHFEESCLSFETPS